jgi:hypothetical protein
MKKKMMILLTMFFLLPGISVLYAQEEVDVLGGDSSGSGGTVSYSVGQVAVSAVSGSSGSIRQGVQQPWEIYLVTGLDAWNGITLDCQVYPNPVGDFLKLKVEGWNWDKLSFKLCDASGRIYLIGEVHQIETTIPVSDLLPGVYLFTVTNKIGLHINTYKIIKN